MNFAEVIKPCRRLSNFGTCVGVHKKLGKILNKNDAALGWESNIPMKYFQQKLFHIKHYVENYVRLSCALRLCAIYI